MVKNAMRIIALEEDDRLVGIEVEQTLGDARAINPGIDSVQHDQHADMQLLKQIARWCERYTPLVALSGRDGLFLNITGCAHLFGGEQKMLADVSARLEAQGFQIRLAIADTAGAAWAVARYGNNPIVKSNTSAGVEQGETAVRSNPQASEERAGPQVRAIAGVEQSETAVRSNPQASEERAGPQARAIAGVKQSETAVRSNPLREALEPMPLNALRLPRDQVAEMTRVGFRTIGCIIDLPRAPIAARFGNRVLQRLDQALGNEDEALSPLQPVAKLVAEKRFPEPLVYEEDIQRTIRILADNLALSLEKHGTGMRQCELVLFRVDGEIVSLTVEASNPLRNVKRIADLFDERLASLHDDWEAGFGFDVIRLSVLRSERLEAKQETLTHDTVTTDTIAHLVDRLSSRLGSRQVLVCETADTHIPERQFALVPAVHHQAQGNAALQQESQVATRPIILLSRPELAEVVAEVPEGPPIRFRWRKAQYEVARYEGPERIACEWWKDGRGIYSRDYFRIETNDGHRLWLFRYGLYVRETDIPKWYVHGMFG